MEQSAPADSRAFVEAYLDQNPLSRGLAQAAAKIRAWGHSISGLGDKLITWGNLITKPLAGIVNGFVDSTVAMSKMSERTGVGIEQLSGLAFAAKQSGIEIDTLEMGLKKMQKALFAAHGGSLFGGKGTSQEAAMAFRQAGVSLKELKAQTPEEQLKTLADVFANMTDPTKKAGLAMALFGKSGTELIPFLNKGKAGLDELIQKGREFGLVMTQEDVDAAKSFRSAMRDLHASFEGVAHAIGAAIAPGMARLRNLVLPTVQTVTRWARENAGLADTLFDVATGITAAGVGLVVIGKTLGLAAAAVGGLLLPVKLLVGTLFTVASAGAAAFGFLVSPIGLVTAAIVGMGAAFLLAGDQGKATQDGFASAWAGIKETALDSWQGIVDAVKAGDIVLAGKIVWAGLKAIWAEGIANLTGAWSDFTGFFVDVWAQAVQDVAQHLNSLINDPDVRGFLRGFTSTLTGGLVDTGMPAADKGDVAKALREDFEREQKARGARREQKKNDDIAAAQAELDNAKIDLANLAEQANIERASREAKMAAGTKAAAGSLGGTGMMGESAGTFSAYGALGIGAGLSVQEQQLEQLKKLTDIEQQQLEKEWGPDALGMEFA